MSDNNGSKPGHRDRDEGVFEQILATEHPLNNAVVLDEIFNQLSTVDLKSARLVNKTWLSSSLHSRWRDQKIYDVVFENDENQVKIKKFTGQFLEQKHPTNNPNDPLQLSRYPIQNISVSSRYCWTNRCIISEPDRSQFWQLFGHGLKHLRLSKIQIHRGALLKRLLFELTPNLEEFVYYCCVCDDMDTCLNSSTEYTPPAKIQKNLTYFHFWTWSDWKDERRRYKPRFPISWIEFFSMFPNLKKLVILPNGSGMPRDLLKLFEAIDIIRKANNNEVLNISLFHTFGSELAHIDMRKNQSLFASLPIVNLSIEITDMKRDDIVLFVQSFKSTLRDLTLKNSEWEVEESESDDDEDHNGNDSLPKDFLPQGLQKLMAEGRLFSSFEFLLYTPDLKELIVDSIPCILPPEVDVAAVAPLVKLESLSCSGYPESRSASREDMEILVKLIPNVKTFSFGTVEPEGFEVLCEQWADCLEDLHLKLNFDFDEDVFVKSLIQLKCLRFLYIWGSFEIKDKSVYDGFLQMPFLKRVCVPKFFAKITDAGCQAMRDKLRFHGVC